jgi:hypothetical protein
LLVRCAPNCWPDIRVVVDDRSVSLWIRQTADGQLIGGLPGKYLSAFTGSAELTLGLRMFGHRLRLAPITIPMAEAGSADRS